MKRAKISNRTGPRIINVGVVWKSYLIKTINTEPVRSLIFYTDLILFLFLNLYYFFDLLTFRNYTCHYKVLPS